MRILHIQRSPVFLLGLALAAPGSQAAPAKASLAGRVVNAATGEAVRRVSVTLACTGAKGESATAVTGSDGRFAITDLEPGDCRLAGQRNGFQRTEYGARLSPSSGIPVSIKAGQEIRDLTLKLVPDATIAGRVIDPEGEPMPGLTVAVLRGSYAAGRRQWTQSGGVETNDRGEYRVAGLRAGRYIVRAADLNVGAGILGASRGPLPEKAEAGYAATYFGNTVDMGRAAPVDLRMGEERRVADIQVMKVNTVRVRGHVSGAPEGKTPMVLLIRKGSALTGNSATAVGLAQHDGTFELRGVTPGSYLLTATSPLGGLTATASVTPVEVGEQHVDGIELRLDANGSDVSGSISLPGGASKLNGVEVALEMVDFDLLLAPHAHAGEDGAFTLKNVLKGKYRVRVSGLPENAYVSGYRLDGVEIDESEVEIGGSGRLDIAVSPAGAEVDGRVLGEDGQPLAGATVALIPESHRESTYATASSSPDGTFTLKGARPGIYKILAWEDVEPGAYMDAEFVKTFESRVQALALEDGARAKVTLKAAPAR